MIYTVFGALTGEHGRAESHQLRLKHQALAAAVLLAGASVGTFLSVTHLHSWGLVVGEALFAGAGSLFSDKVRLKPNGPFFCILVPVVMFVSSSVFTSRRWGRRGRSRRRCRGHLDGAG
jgi:hypothetical protein